MDLINFVLCVIDIISTPFCDATIITYEIELPPYGKIIGFNFLGDKEFTIPYIIDTVPNFPSWNQLPTQVKKNVWIIAINGEEPITGKGALLYKLRIRHTRHGKSNINISSCQIKKSTSGQICNKLGPDLIKPDLWFYILNFVSQQIL